MIDELGILSKNLIRVIEQEDKEYDFKKYGSYVEKNVPASKFKQLL